nr:MAG TPA: ATPase [Caudoviricetes sp.]
MLVGLRGCGRSFENSFGLFFPTDKVSIHPLWCATQ